MGGFYVNHMVCNTNVPAIIEAAPRDQFYLLKMSPNCSVAFDKLSEEQDEDYVASVAKKFSLAPGSTVLSVLVHDDSITIFWVAKNGAIINKYHSNPNYFSATDPPSPPVGGDAMVLCKIFHCFD